MNSLKKPYDVDLGIKGQGHKEVMMVPDTSWTQIHGKKAIILTLNSLKKPYDFDLGIKGQGHKEVVKVLDTLSDGDTPMCQI